MFFQKKVVKSLMIVSIILLGLISCDIETRDYESAYNSDSEEQVQMQIRSTTEEASYAWGVDWPDSAWAQNSCYAETLEWDSQMNCNDFPDSNIIKPRLPFIAGTKMVMTEGWCGDGWTMCKAPNITAQDRVSSKCQNNEKCLKPSHANNIKYSYDFDYTTIPPDNCDYNGIKCYILAASDGQVIESGSNNNEWGNTIVIKHYDGYKSRYAHLEKIFPWVEKNSYIKQGTLLGILGGTGKNNDNSDWKHHLHFNMMNSSSISVPFNFVENNGRIAYTTELTSTNSRNVSPGEYETHTPDNIWYKSSKYLKLYNKYKDLLSNNCDIGLPENNKLGGKYVHVVDNIHLQDFKKSTSSECVGADGLSLLVYNEDVDEAFHVKKGFYGAYKCISVDGKNMKGPQLLGAPISDEYIDKTGNDCGKCKSSSPANATVQKFDKGCMWFNPPDNDHKIHVHLCNSTAGFDESMVEFDNSLEIGCDKVDITKNPGTETCPDDKCLNMGCSQHRDPFNGELFKTPPTVNNPGNGVWYARGDYKHAFPTSECYHLFYDDFSGLSCIANENAAELINGPDVCSEGSFVRRIDSAAIYRFESGKLRALCGNWTGTSFLDRWKYPYNIAILIDPSKWAGLTTAYPIDYGRGIYPAGEQSPKCGDPGYECGTFTDDVGGICHAQLNCGACPTCGDSVCDSSHGETCSSCSTDCGSCETCGDSICSSADGEDCSSCSQDCGVCNYLVAGEITSPANGITVSNEQFSINWTNGYSEGYSTETALYCQIDGGEWVRSSGFGQILPFNFYPSAPGQTISCKVRTRMSVDYTTFTDSSVVTWYTSSTYPNIVVQSAQIRLSPEPNGCDDIYIDATFKNVGDQTGSWMGFAYLHPTGEDETSVSAIKARWNVPLDATPDETVTKTFRIDNGFALPLVSGDWSVTIISDDYYNHNGTPSKITIPAYGEDLDAPVVTFFRVNGYQTTPVEVVPGIKYSINASVSDNYALSSWELRWRESSSGFWQTIEEQAFSLNTCNTYSSNLINWTVPSILSAGQLIDVSMVVTDFSGRTSEQIIQVKTRSNAEPSVNFIKPVGGEVFKAKAPDKPSCIPVEFYFIPGVQILQIQMGLVDSGHTSHRVDYVNGKITQIPEDGHVSACIDAEYSGDELQLFVEIYDKNHITHYFYSENITINFPEPLAPWKTPVLDSTQFAPERPDTLSTWLNSMSFSGIRVSNNKVSVYRKDVQCPYTYYEGQKKRLAFSKLEFRLSDYGLISTTKILDNYREEAGACSEQFSLEDINLFPATNYMAANYRVKDNSSCVIVNGENRCDFDFYIREVKNNTVTAPTLIKRYTAQFEYYQPSITMVSESSAGNQFLYIDEYVGEEYKTDLFKNSEGTYSFLINESILPKKMFLTTNGLLGMQREKIGSDAWRYSSYYLNEMDGARSNMRPILETGPYSNMASFKDPYSDEVHFIDFIRNVPNRKLQYAVYSSDTWTVYTPIIPPETWRGKTISFISIYDIIGKGEKVYLAGQMNLMDDENSYYFTLPYKSDNTINLDDAYVDTYQYGITNGSITSEMATILPDGRLIRILPCQWNMKDRLCFQESFEADKDCWDNNPCTDDIWNSSTGMCTHELKQCPDDGNICNGPEICDPTTGECVSDAFSSIKCDDGNKCNGEETCDPESGTCVSGSQIETADAFVCTEDKCDELTGEVTHVASNDLCYTEPCFMSQCAPDNPLADENTGCIVLEKPILSDGLDCTEDSCNEMTGMLQYDVNPDYCVIEGACIQNGINKGDNICVVCDSSVDSYSWTPVTDNTSCSDSLSCTESDKCIDGVCVGTQKYCASETLTSPCSSFQCSELTGSCETLVQEDGSPCNDFTVCNGAETCQEGLCLSGPALECNDKNACTADSCDDLEGCKHATLPDGTVCDEAKTGAQRCFSGNCIDEKAGQTCETAKELTLGTEYIAHFEGRFDLIQEYTCTDLSFTGPEVYFSILLKKGKYNITVTPGEGTDPSIFILDSCEEQHCTALSMGLETGEPEEMIINIKEDDTKLVFVVDFTAYSISDSVEVAVKSTEIQDEDNIGQDEDFQENDTYDQDTFDEDNEYIPEIDKDVDEDEENKLSDEEIQTGCSCSLVQ